MRPIILVFVFLYWLPCIAEQKVSTQLNEEVYYYQAKQSDGLGNILRKLHFKHLWEPNGWVEKIAHFNSLEYKRGNRVWLLKNQWIKIPVKSIPTAAYGTYKVSKNRVLNFITKTSKRRLATSKLKQEYKFEFKIQCDWSTKGVKGSENCRTKINSNLEKEKIHSMEFSSNFSGHNIQFSIGSEFNSKQKTNSPKEPRLSKKEVHKLALLNDQAMFSQGKTFYALPRWEKSFSDVYNPNNAYYLRSPQSMLKSRLPEANHFFPQVGIVRHNYQQDITQYESTDLNLIIGYRRVLNGPWHFDSDANVTLLTMEQKGSNSTTRFAELNLRAGYSIPIFDEPWRFTLFGGVYAATMIVDQDRYGYQPLVMPQLYPEMRRVFQGGNILSFYAKWVPTNQDVGKWLEGSEQAFSVGGRWGIPGIYGHPLMFNFEWGKLNYKPKNSQSLIHSEAITLGIGSNF